jgi:hypothetical protein
MQAFSDTLLNRREMLIKSLASAVAIVEAFLYNFSQEMYVICPV